MPVSLNAGLYPNGWLFGVDIQIADVVSQLQTGYPFVGSLDGSGNSSFGPIGGAPPGLTLYAVGLGFPGTVVDFPTANTAPRTYTIP
jgi:hypothetical protein